MTAAEIYQALRRQGRLVLPADQATLISGVRRLAKADGLAISQYRAPAARNAARWQVRERPYDLSLTRRGSDLVYAPDSSIGSGLHGT